MQTQMVATPNPSLTNENQCLLGLKITSTDSLTPFFNWQGSAGQGVIMTCDIDDFLLPINNNKQINDSMK